MFTEEEKKNLTVLIEVGAKSLSQDKPLRESLAIQSVAVTLIERILNPQPAPEPSKTE